MNKSINQRVHEYLGNKGLLMKTNCAERGCDKYHGSNPSQSIMFYAYKGLEKGLDNSKDIFDNDNQRKLFIDDLVKFNLEDK